MEVDLPPMGGLELVNFLVQEDPGKAFSRLASPPDQKGVMISVPGCQPRQGLSFS